MNYIKYLVKYTFDDEMEQRAEKIDVPYCELCNIEKYTTDYIANKHNRTDFDWCNAKRIKNNSTKSFGAET